MDYLQKYFQENPYFFGIVLIIVGIIVFISVKIDARWLMGDNTNTYNLKKLDGWINVFGKRTGKIIGYIISVMLIVAGIIYSIVL
jgi:hypothetical protein